MWFSYDYGHWVGMSAKFLVYMCTGSNYEFALRCLNKGSIAVDELSFINNLRIFTLKLITFLTQYNFIMTIINEY